MEDLIVLIPCFNNESGLQKTLSSIRESVNVLVVDDGSVQKIDPQKLNFHAGKLFLIRLEHNSGVAIALNVGLAWVLKNNYNYVARLDAGDEVLAGRFMRQYQYLQAHPECMLLGAWANFVDSQGQWLFSLKYPTKHDDIAKAMYNFNPFLHPTVIYHIEVYKQLGGYPENYPALEDYAYFFLIVKSFVTANLPEVLLNYVDDEQSVSTQFRRVQSYSKVKLLCRHYDFSLIATRGLIKALLLCLFSRKMTTRIKKILWRA